MITIRWFFALSAIAAIATLCGAAAVSSQSAPVQKVFPFALNQVTLLPSPFKNAMDRTCNYLLFLNKDRMLYSFRKNYGLDTKGATSYGGWEASNNAIRGHTMGHLLSALSQAYAATADARYKAKADSLVVELQKCQDAAASAGFTSGYLAAIPESVVDDMLARKSARCPLYNIHKTFAGLLDCYQLLGNKTALDIATKIGDWACTRLTPYTAAQLDAIWDDYSVGSGEYGGFADALGDLYAITGSAKYLTATRLFYHSKLFDPVLAGTDALSGRHGNRSIPEITGTLKVYQNAGDANSLKIAQNFFTIVTANHSYITGGTGQKEYFKASKAIAAYLTDLNNETCCIYNMLKMTRRLFFYDPQPAYMDYYERALYNQILASQDTVSPNGHTTYFQPMRSGGIKIYGNDQDTFKCCQGTGLENHTKYGESIFFHAADTLYVNLFIPAQLAWTEKNLIIKLETRYPDSDTIRLTLTGTSAVPLKIRAPFWLRRSVVAKVNGVKQTVSATSGTYFNLNAPMNGGAATVELVMPQTIRFEKTPDNATIGGALYGAQALVGCYGNNDLSSTPNLDASTVKKTTASALSFTGTASTGTVTLVPFYRMCNQRYSIYWNLTNVPSDPFVVHALPRSEVSPGISPIANVRLASSKIRVTFASQIPSNKLIRLEFYNQAGQRLASCIAQAHQGEREVAFLKPDRLSVSALRICRVFVGENMVSMGFVFHH